MTPRHLVDLFSAAYEDDLSPAERTRFEAHVQACEPCAAAYEEFKAGIAVLRELPQARMPHAVHLPSTSPVAERRARPTIGLSWFNLGLLRRFPATAAAGAIAIVLVVLALTHVGTGGNLSTAALPASGGANGSTAPLPAHSSTEVSCTQPTAIIGSSPPVSFAQETQAADPTEPALHLVLAAPRLVVAAGKSAVVYAQLSVPVSAAANPGSVASAPPTRALLPCLSVGVANTTRQLLVLPPSSASLAIPQATGSGFAVAPGTELSAAGPLVTFVVPTGLAPGTELHVIATIPAGFAAFGSPALTAELTLTIG